jgi:hypothetical protein
VMIFPRGAVEWRETLAAGQVIRVGEALGRTTGPQ